MCEVPTEILEEILVNLPLKSLLRFSAVSKSWNSLIFGSRFVQLHRSRVEGRVMLLTVPSADEDDCNYQITSAASVCPISLTSSEHPIAMEDSTDVICPIGGTPILRAFCDQLSLVESEKSLFLWNHSTRAHRKLPDPLDPLNGWRTFPPGGFVYGLAYDSGADDYRILKLARENLGGSRFGELYSLKSNSWKKIPPHGESWIPGRQQSRCEFVNGAFHWIARVRRGIHSFNLSTEKHGEVVFRIPSDGGRHRHQSPEQEVVVLRGMLCVCDNYIDYSCPHDDTEVSGVCLWVMKEYGVEESWTKICNIQYYTPMIHVFPYTLFSILRPLYLYDNGDILFNLSEIKKKNNMVQGLFMYRNVSGGEGHSCCVYDGHEGFTTSNSLLEKIMARRGGLLLYVESLVSPWPCPTT